MLSLAPAQEELKVRVKILRGLLPLVMLAVIAHPARAQEMSLEGVEVTAGEVVQGVDLTEGDIEARAARLEEQLAELDRRIEEVRALNAGLDRVPESEREAVLYRRDERSFQLIRDLDDLARAAAELPEDEAIRQELTRRLREDYAGVPDTIYEYTADLTRRIGEHHAELESMSGPQRLGMEAYLEALRRIRIASYVAAADLVESRQALGLPVQSIVEKLRDTLFLHAESLIGRLRFNASAAEEMEARLKDDPQNADLATTAKQYATLHAEDRERLSAISDVMARLGIDNTAYRSVLLEQGQEFSVRDLERDLLLEMFGDGWASLRSWLAENGPDLVFKLAVVLLILFVFRVLSRLTRRAVIAACDRSGEQMSTLLKDVLASVSGATVMVIGILIALSQVGVSIGPALAGLGVAGFIIGFALQDTLGNFAAGGMILIYRPYDVDDFVEVAGASGLVKKMSLVSTTITTFDNQTLVVPNSKIWGDVIKNVTAQRVRRVDMEFGIGYGDDVDKAERVLRDIVQEHELVLDTPEPTIRLHTLGDSSVNFIVRPWVRTADYWGVYWDITREVKVRFDREGITIPFPQRDVHLFSAES